MKLRKKNLLVAVYFGWYLLGIKNKRKTMLKDPMSFLFLGEKAEEKEAAEN